MLLYLGCGCEDPTCALSAGVWFCPFHALIVIQERAQNQHAMVEIKRQNFTQYLEDMDALLDSYEDYKALGEMPLPPQT